MGRPVTVSMRVAQVMPSTRSSVLAEPPLRWSSLHCSLTLHATPRVDPVSDDLQRSRRERLVDRCILVRASGLCRLEEMVETRQLLDIMVSITGARERGIDLRE